MSSQTSTSQGAVLYLGVPRDQSGPSTLVELVDTLREFASELIPEIETHAALAISDRGIQADNVALIREALVNTTSFGDLALARQSA